jgi:transcriptional regulator with XRE-family HTH domain
MAMSGRETVAERFAANLFKHRRQAGLTQQELADRTGLHRTEIGYLEGRKRLPRIDTFLKLCDSLEARPDQLLDGVDWLWDQQRFISIPRSASGD